MNTSLFYINEKNISEIMLEKNEWIHVENFTPELFEDLKINKTYFRME